MSKNIYEFLWECYDNLPEFSQYIYENIPYESQWMDDDGGTDVEYDTVMNFFEGLVNEDR